MNRKKWISKEALCKRCDNSFIKQAANHCYCESCVKEKAALSQLVYEAKHREALGALKQKTGCECCDEVNVKCLQVHHLSSEQKWEGRKCASVKNHKKDYDDGLAIILCASCHLLFHNHFGGANKEFPPQTKESVIKIINLERHIGG